MKSTQPQPLVPRQPTPTTPTDAVRDRLGRPLHDLRISVLDRCNLRCGYCMPADSLQGQGIFLPKESLLTDAEIVHLVRAFTRLGVHKLRLTGGEPLLRPGLVSLVKRLACIDGIDDLALTTNGILLPRHAAALKEAGLHRLTVSLDSLDEAVFAQMSGGRGSAAEVMAGIEAARQAGFGSLKINTVVQRGVNEDQVLDLVGHFRGSGHVVRMIEFMDVGHSNNWAASQVVPSDELRARIHQRWPLEPVQRQSASAPARRWRFLDGQGEVGFISSVSEPFCGTCTRARLAADGTFYSCLFASHGTLLRPIVRGETDTQRLVDYLSGLWSGREDRYSEIRGTQATVDPRVEMYRMGG
ncbi:GTP 3',8-cyclase MoaA [Marinihelvus fidelis]|uniref:GTP 3',8-cyclase n=1 Tax=Marinihelvus fidelis TaxID=2613842 RepID=A0A5N0TB59_9GAMM|nr:GTP 3',8-cyclase MoaA [Marinihelvus fidelis]KAA9131908.1 GTP 3',8-cyclase MoaA [Marinihelvus fidelis]